MDPWLFGIDVSNHQGVINWDKLNANPNIAFVWGLVSDGTFRGTPSGGAVSVSAAYNANKKNCKKPFGAYHFARPRTTDPYNIAESVVNWCGEGCQMPLVLDVEDGAVGDMPLVDLVGWCRAWLVRVEELEGRRPVIYTKTNGMIRFFPNHVWWLPFYPANSKVNPNPEEYRAWMDARLRGNDGRYYDCWQYSQRGRLDGIPGYVDLSLINPLIYKDLLHIPEDEMTTSCVAHANVLLEDTDDNTTAGLRARGFTPFPDLAFQCFDNGTMRQLTGDEVRTLTGIFKAPDVGFQDDRWFSLLTLMPRDQIT